MFDKGHDNYISDRPGIALLVWMCGKARAATVRAGRRDGLFGAVRAPLGTPVTICNSLHNHSIRKMITLQTYGLFYKQQYLSVKFMKNSKSAGKSLLLYRLKRRRNESDEPERTDIYNFSE